MQCFACGTEVVIAAGARVGFRACCEHCGADLHVCRNCRHHDPSAYNECRESSAERVGDRERANRCDHFAAGGRADGEAGRATAAAETARSRLEALFKKAP